MNIEPLNGMLLLEALPPKEQTRGGIILPDSAKERSNQGRLVSKTKGDYFAAGDILVFPMHTEYTIVHEDKKYYLVRDTDIIARVKPTE